MIITDRSAPPPRFTISAMVFVSATIAGTIAAVHFARLGLTLSHYDARAHLVVARRLADSLTPGWRQIGAVWLPLPHLLDAIPVLSPWAYQTGYPVVAISILSLAMGLAALAAYLMRQRASPVVAIATPAVILANPNLLYLQSTPMTEPLLLGLAFVSLWLVDRWIERPDRRRSWHASLALVALMLTRYEGWCIALALVTIAALVNWRRGVAVSTRLFPAVIASVGGFLLLSYGATGAFFVTSGFFVPENPAHHAPMVALDQVVMGTRALGGGAVVGAGMIGGVLCLIALARLKHQALALAIVSAAALPSFAFFEGHPYRVRYMVMVVAGAGTLAAMAIARLPRRAQPPAAVLLFCAAIWQHPPFERTAPMVLEAQWETPFRLQRAAVTAYLVSAYDGTPILASMGSLGHYMQETSAAGFRLADFLHEGNGDLWAAALESPARHVRWVLTEGRAEGGDMLAQRARTDPAFLRGFAQVADGGGLVLYRRVDEK
ncbi:MAG: hypothetical protein ABI634_10360 [Acidobacteriota bacterium]